MSLRKRLCVIVVWLSSIVAVGVLAHAKGSQAPIPAPGWRDPRAQGPAPTIISGNDLGFRVDTWKGQTPAGTLVVRINGQWVDADFGVAFKRLTER